MDKQWDGWSALAWLERGYLSMHNGNSATAASTVIQVQTNIDCTECRARRTSLLSADEAALPGKIKYEYGIKNED